MLTGMLAVRNLVFGEDNDIWSVNAEQEYLEEAIEGALRDSRLGSDLFHPRGEHPLAQTDSLGSEQDTRPLLVRGRLGGRRDGRGRIRMDQRVGVWGASTDQSVLYWINLKFPMREIDPK